MTRPRRTKVPPTDSSSGPPAADGVRNEPGWPTAEAWVLQLLPIAGVSCREQRVSDWIRGRLADAGYPESWITSDDAHQRTPTPGQVGNLLLRLPGSTAGPRYLFSAHLDTVPICEGCQPVLEGRIVRSAEAGTGLGADNRAGAAVLLHTAVELKRTCAAHGPITFLWTVQEELGLQGARVLDPVLVADCVAGFNWDGGAADKLTIGATGGHRLRLDITGLASHAGNAPERGVSAVTIAALAIADLHRAGWLGRVEREGRLGTSNVGVVRGGTATNVVADAVRVLAEARSHDRRFREEIVAAMHEAFERAAREVRSEQGACGSVKCEDRLDYESFSLDRKERCVVTAQRAVSALGHEPQLAVANGGLDANWLTVHGVPTVSLGCGQQNQHCVTERLDLDQFVLACRIAWQLAVNEPRGSAAGVDHG